MALNKHNNIITSGRWYTKDPEYVHILDLVVVAQNLMDD